MGETTKLVARQRLREAGVTYVVEVLAAEGGCVGHWTCPKCNLGGRSAVKFAAVEEAAAWAKRAAKIHHAASHSDGVDNSPARDASTTTESPNDMFGGTN